MCIGEALLYVFNGKARKIIVELKKICLTNVHQLCAQKMIYNR